MGLFKINKREAARRRIVQALKDGRILSIYDSKEFRCSQMHTEFCKIRRMIVDGKIEGYEMKDRWTVNRNGVRYKEYWFERG